MSNTSNQPDSAAIDASISVLGEDAGEPKVAKIDGVPARDGTADVERSDTTGRAGAQENLEAPIRESEGQGAGGSVERPGGDPDLV